MRTCLTLTLVLPVALAACHGDHAVAPTPLGPCAAGAATVQLSTLQGTTVPCGAGGTIDLAGGGAHYLIVPQFAAGNVARAAVPYVIGAGTPAAANLVSGWTPDADLVGVTDAGAMPAVHPSAQRAFDFALRERERRALETHAWSRASGAPHLTVATTAPDTLRLFHVISSLDTTKTSTKAVTARLAYAGANVLIYIDTAAAPNGFTAGQLTAFGQLFDQTLYPIDVNAFGTPSDIDANGHVIMLLSPVVNALTPAAQCATQGFVAGFFDGYDLVSNAGDSNKGEIFFSVAPDPNGVSGCAHTADELLRTVPPTFLHELQHLISFSQHVVVHHGAAEQGWLDEGMSIVAEELGSVYYEQRYPPPTGRTNPAQLFPDSSQGFIAGALEDSYRYLLEPDTVTATLHSDADGGLAWRGADWLLLRWLGDHESAGFYQRLEQGSTTGVANIEAASGEAFPSLFGDFSLSLWTDSIVGVPKSSIPPRDRFATRTLRTMYQALYRAAGPSADVPRPYPLVPTALDGTAALSARMVPGTAAFYTLATSAGAGAVRVKFTPTSGQEFGSALHAQVSVFRLP